MIIPALNHVFLRTYSDYKSFLDCDLQDIHLSWLYREFFVKLVKLTHKNSMIAISKLNVF